MAAIASELAVAAASQGSGMTCAQATPTRAESMLPATIDQGWANGLDGTANKSTAEAPIGAMSHGLLE
ncbi:hypothetical protein GCM10009304_00740 [Pseudomonas matsuisoli]|uniref:Uncharacterized protein n=1 Tax=Pseudomonas matsuisoli TaxID=1515666 RepID=A0A917PHV0_9PSED|nr:hypothetical protein GCM10009304_00740 [Pseudomonas matsuisoli]